jgi:hydroxymethylbilane synthase
MKPRPTTNLTLRLGTRGSLLALTQSQIIADALERYHPGLQVDVNIISTSGDRVTDRLLHDDGGKGLFTKELELALLANEIDFAVHSMKDVPITEPLIDAAELTIEAVPHREDPRDVLVSTRGYRTLEQLPPNARVGTASLRRKSQILDCRPDLRIEVMRGNIDTRLCKLGRGEFDAILLAFAGLHRSGMFDQSTMTIIEPDVIVPAAGQGALAVQCRADDLPTRSLLSVLNDPNTAQCVELERAVVQALSGDCHSPIGALAAISDEKLMLRVAVGGRDGRPPVIRAAAEADAWDSQRALANVLRALREQHAVDMLADATAA